MFDDTTDPYLSTDNKYKILGSFWVTNTTGSFGIVASESVQGKWKCYIGMCKDGNSEAQDEQHIARWGTSLPRLIALAVFPDLDPEGWIN